MAEQNLKRMKRRRTANKNVLTGLLVKAKDGLQKEYDDDLKVELQTLLRTIQEQEATVKALDNDILNLIEDDDELETDLKTSVDFGIDVTTGITKIINFLKKNSIDTLSSSSGSSSGRKATTKLPKLTLQKFNGDSLKWKPFLDSFNIAVGENDELSGVEKMNYLKSLLTEKAEQTISGLALSNENYPIAMKLLEERFGDEQIIISSHMNKLLELPKIMNVKDIIGLRILYDTAESQIRSLQAFGLLVKNYGPLLVPVILSKLPDSLKLIISQKSDSDIWDAENILKVLQKEILAREKLNTIGETVSDFGEFAGLHVGGGESRKNSCTFCDGKHKSHNCRTVSNIEARKQIIRRKGLCFVCLEKGHLSKNCRRNFTCFKCGKKHHTSLCFGKKTERTEIKPAADTGDQGTEKANDDKTERTETAENTTSTVTESIHVDDLTTGAGSESSAFEFYDNCKTKLKEGGFNLRKFKSNSKNLESWIVKDFGSNELEKGEQTKVLGVSWNKADDKLCFDFDELLQNQIEPLTKRNVMHFIASIYDPLGLINPVVVTMKCFLKELFKEKLGWDDPLPETLKSRWISILKGLENCKIEIDRLYSLKEFEDPFVNVQLHGFSDASKVAFGASMYLRFVYNSGKIKVVLIAGKSRVKPNKVKSIPRLELLGTLLISRLAQTVREELSSVFTLDDRTHLWTDSSCAYCWIINEDKTFKRFVENRVCKIRKLTESACWHLVPSKSNPADIISKGSSPGELGDLWFRGPKFLALPETSWPQLLPGDKFDEYKEEVKPVIALSAPATEIDLRELIPLTRYNSFLKLIRVTAWVMRFIRNIRMKKEEGRLPTNNNQNGPWLSAKELTDTRKLWIKHEQLSIKNLNDVGRNLGNYLDDDGLIRCRGRLDNANLTFNEKYPYLLPSSRLAQMIVYDVHNSIQHAGVRDTLVELRQEFWIPKGRNFVRKALFDCNTCKRVNAKPYAYPEPPSLPVDRVTGTTAFKNVGLDYAGPLHVKNVFGDDEELYKAWISVATCTSSRGVHLDIAADASADECVEILRRLIARHGAPDIVRSDNGTNFVSETVQNFASSRNIDWKFSIEAAPWMGGFWERLVQSVKRPLRKVLSNSTLRFNELLTVLMEIEVMINNRPLTYVYPEMEEALTPNHLIFGRRINTVAEKLGEQTAQVEKRVQYLETLLEHFWNRWNKEYLTELREHWKQKRMKRQPITKVNDIVLIMDDKLARSKWRVGIIEKLIPSNDGQIRAATVRTVTETGRISYLRRPVNKLIPLEVSDEEDEIHRREIKFVDEEKMKFILPYTPGH
ncbi:uncharacterized protein [Clytia hemisphaerica]|uniref:uncharacterized protein n=1 Tax=Clytia hemisphaerica TaxID=252671 RepID=UPI0034D6F5BD